MVSVKRQTIPLPSYFILSERDDEVCRAVGFCEIQALYFGWQISHVFPFVTIAHQSFSLIFSSIGELLRPWFDQTNGCGFRRDPRHQGIRTFAQPLEIARQEQAPGESVFPRKKWLEQVRLIS